MSTIHAVARSARLLGLVGLAVFGLVSGAALTGAEAATLTHVRQEAIYSPTLVQSLARDGILKAEIHGSPVGGADAGQIAAQVPGPAFLANVRVEPREGRNRLVLVFNPVQITNPDSLCSVASSGAIPTTGPGGMQVQAALCLGDTAISRAVLQGPAVPSVEDPAFRQSMGELISSLIPLRSPHDSSRCLVPGC
ncbi:hypothetical protein [Zavarzinia sp. CC-PAN008]|uniref:hypothetical protein n=1 Tax=Zavarzinia sp. CC-PAN008 TaxID=3243332 RepID=UPI003F748102